MPDDPDLELHDLSRPGTPTQKRRTRFFAELVLQHASSSWGVRTVDFAIFLGLIDVFPDTLLPASIYGFAIAATGAILSSWMGSLVDHTHQLSIVRWSVFGQKLSAIALCGFVIGMLGSPANIQKGLLGLTVAMGCLNKLATILNQVSVEREWTVTIANGSSEDLTFLNAWLRRADLLTSLLAPLFASLLLSVTSYRNGFAILAGMDALLLVFELFCQLKFVPRRKAHSVKQGP
jgi:iron-regulated transporter 1